MKRIFLILALLSFALGLPAQTNEAVKLALLAESNEASAASDGLGRPTYQRGEKFNLLERNEIEKVYREQGLSAENKDFLKLGHILGADGLLLLDVVRTKFETNLTARL